MPAMAVSPEPADLTRLFAIVVARHKRRLGE
jgi:hypothetical protein